MAQQRQRAQVQDQDRINLILKDNLSPGLIKPVDEDGYLAVIMPMQTMASISLI